MTETQGVGHRVPRVPTLPRILGRLAAVAAVLTSAACGPQDPGSNAPPAVAPSAPTLPPAAPQPASPPPSPQAPVAQPTPTAVTCIGGGSTQAEVRQLLGEPDSISQNWWIYGRSQILFGYGTVQDYMNAGNLPVCGRR